MTLISLSIIIVIIIVVVVVVVKISPVKPWSGTRNKMFRGRVIPVT